MPAFPNPKCISADGYPRCPPLAPANVRRASPSRQKNLASIRGGHTTGAAHVDCAAAVQNDECQWIAVLPFEFVGDLVSLLVMEVQLTLPLSAVY